MTGSPDLEPIQPESSRPPTRPSHPPIATALLLIAVLALIIGMAAISTFS